jgi:cell division protein DivIC
MSSFSAYVSKATVVKLLKNKYFIATIFILLWMLFLDRNNWIHQFNKYTKLQEMKAEKAYYKQKIKETREARKELMKNSESLERFAREEYFMKKPDEELYIITDHQKEAKE